MIRPELKEFATPINDLKPHPNNVRQGDIGAISQSLEQHGQYRPIVVQRSTGFILAGNHTYKAAISLKWKQIAATYVDCDDEQALRILLIDNRANDLASYDDSALVEMLKSLMDTELKLEGTGFDPDDLDQLLKDLDMESGNAIEGDPDAVPDDAPSKTVLGDVWLLGDHRLMCGDSTSPTDIEHLTQGLTMEMAFTDPPYGVAYTGGLQFKSDGSVIKNNREMIKNDDIDIYSDVFPLLAKTVDGPCYVWFAGTKAAKLYEAAEQYGDIHALIIWVKNGGYGALNANYKQKHEPCLYWKPHGSTLNFTGATTETTIWDIDKDGRNKLHPTQKPVALALKAIGNHSSKTVLDLFGGSGSTLIAAHQTGRTAYLMELDPHYCDVICKRFQQATGITPIAEATGNEHSFIE